MCKYDVASQLLDLHVFEEILGFDFRFSVSVFLFQFPFSVLFSTVSNWLKQARRQISLLTSYAWWGSLRLIPTMMSDNS